MTLNEAIGKNVRRIRKERGLTLFELSRKTEFVLRDTQLSQMERAQIEWRATSMEVVAKALGIQPSDMLPKE